MMKKDILERLLSFSTDTIRLARQLPGDAAGRVLVSQLIRSATSIGANVEEAQDASSKKEFINKMGIALREARETRYWISIILNADLLKGVEVDKLLNECKEICAILTSIVKHAKTKS